MKTKRMIYDEICALLTRYEMDGTGEDGDVSMGELYEMLVEVQNSWEDTITACDCGNGNNDMMSYGALQNIINTPIGGADNG